MKCKFEEEETKVPGGKTDEGLQEFIRNVGPAASSRIHRRFTHPVRKKESKQKLPASELR